MKLRRVAAAAGAIACCLVFTQCSPAPSPAPTEGPKSSAASPKARTITDANLIKASDLPSPIGGGKIVEYDRNARSLDELTVCQPEPLTALGASMAKSRSFRARYSPGNRPFPRSSLNKEPDTYAVVMQFSDPAAAQRARAIYDSWMVNCEDSSALPKGVRALHPGFSWTAVAADPAQAQVSEVVYRRDGSDRYSYFESVGLTVLEDRMMITVHLFYTDESVYSLNVDDDEAGFAHPQLGLVQAAAKRLSE